MLKIALLRVGIDTGCGGIHAPLFNDTTFEYIPIPDGHGIDKRTYGNTKGRRHARNLSEYFPERLKLKMLNQPMHVDPEFTTFTYGDPTPPKAGLRKLEKGDILIFYCGLEGWGNYKKDPALYLLGYFEVLKAGFAINFSEKELKNDFGGNFHVMHKKVFKEQKERLVLIKGSGKSKLFKKAVCISSIGKDVSGKPLKVLSPQMQKVFGDFNGKISIQRSPTRWIEPGFVQKAAKYIRSLE